jgi:anion-transporting  ArsA/GET3 family ATPase
VGLGALVTGSSVVVVCGAGGVGKTTVAAAVGADAALHTEARVLVLTVDPARRLATALGLSEVGNAAVDIAPAVWEAAGRRPKGRLSVAMLDTKGAWDELVRRHAPDAATRAAILGNPLYTNITSKFIASHDYIATERLYELVSEGGYDLIVVDTPPSSQAVEFLDAPARMQEFFASRLLRWLTAPYRSRLVTAASRPFFAVADRILGAQFLSDIANFFILLRTMEKGFVARAAEVEATLRSPATGFVLVTTLEPGPAREALRFAGELRRRGIRLGGLVLNRVLPLDLNEPEAAAAAATLATDAPRLAAQVASRLSAAQPADIRRVLTEVAAAHANLAEAAERQADLAQPLVAEAGGAAQVVRLPALAEDLTDLGAVLRLAERLLAAGPGAAQAQR